MKFEDYLLEEPIFEGLVIEELDEIWRDVPGYRGLYSVSTLGRIRKRIQDNEEIIKPIKNKSGYLSITLQGTKWMIHRLVILTFDGPTTDDKPLVRHLNDIKTDNRLRNLEYGTNEENVHDRILNGRFALNRRLERMKRKNAPKVVSVGQREEIRQHYRQGISYEDLAKIYDTDVNAIKDIIYYNSGRIKVLEE